MDYNTLLNPVKKMLSDTSYIKKLYVVKQYKKLKNVNIYMIIIIRRQVALQNRQKR